MVSRRAALAGLMGSVLGCVTIGTVGYQVGQDRGSERTRNRYQERLEEVEDRYRDPTTNDRQIANAEFSGEIPHDEFRKVTVESEKEMLLTVAMAASSHIDVYTISDEDWQAYENRNDSNYHMLASEEDTSQTGIRETLYSGKYHIVADNTTMGLAQPEGEVTASLQAEAYVRPDD